MELSTSRGLAHMCNYNERLSACLTNKLNLTGGWEWTADSSGGDAWDVYALKAGGAGGCHWIDTHKVADISPYPFRCCYR